MWHTSRIADGNRLRAFGSAAAIRSERRKPVTRRLFLELLEDRKLLSSVPPPAGIVSWWAGDGNATDLVGSNAGTLNNGVTFHQGEVADGFNFNGNDYVSAGTTGLPTGKNDRTMEMWVKINAFPSAGETFFAGYGNFGSDNQSYSLGTVGSTLFWSQWGTRSLGRPWPQTPGTTWR